MLQEKNIFAQTGYIHQLTQKQHSFGQLSQALLPIFLRKIPSNDISFFYRSTLSCWRRECRGVGVRLVLGTQIQVFDLLAILSESGSVPWSSTIMNPKQCYPDPADPGLFGSVVEPEPEP
jgi:hypothetical protein